MNMTIIFKNNNTQTFTDIKGISKKIRHWGDNRWWNVHTTSNVVISFPDYEVKEVKLY